jgi:hypothetical protein
MKSGGKKIEKIEITKYEGEWAFRGDIRTIVEKINEIIESLEKER